MTTASMKMIDGARPSLDPYGQLLRILVPRASGIAFHDADGRQLWITGDYDGPDPQPVVDEALQSAAPATTAQIDGFARDFQGAPAYAFRMRDDSGAVMAVATLLTRDNEKQSYSFVLHMVRPALECMQRELLARESLGSMNRSLRARDDDLDLLLKVAPGDPQDPQQADELAALTQACVDHLKCVLGALVVPERNVAICKARSGATPQVSILTATHRHLLNWTQLQRRVLLINRVNTTAGGLPPYKILATPVRHPSGRVTGFLAMFRPADAPDFDLRAERLSELLARKASTILQNNYDAATSLLTRSAFELQVTAALAAAGGDQPACVLYLDADRLHVINDNFGMHVGDEVICKIAEVLRRKLLPGALAARIAGDRFAVSLPDCSLDKAEQIAETICRKVSELSYVRSDGTVQVSVSIGVAELPKLPSALPHGLAGAEIACKAAKDRGRSRVEVMQDTDQSMIRRHADVLVVQRVHDALAHDRFTLYCQPMLPLGEAGGEPRFELLLRMVTKDGEVLPPDKFLSAAERYQLLPQIDRWVLRNALSALKSQVGALRGRGMRFSINLSGPSFADEDFLEHLESSVRDSGVPPELLCFELTETAAVSNLVRADRLMQRMRTLGCTFALDDFGTGLSSLAYLKSLPVSTIKIDGSFVRDSATNTRTESMVSAIAQLARTMGMETVAEYVETDEMRMRMAALGVDYGQGFAIGRPIPLAEILSDLALYEAMAVG